ncbi:DEAD/DEAH box helicase [Bifidobacterium sp. SO4]|uniref:DEAD/DEAH box helicase n=1 Tax=Bifidobacterium sp. SO4 TaxID=2809030 RepID=UPI001BDD829F|nr:DEAD/DEAH box helicase [Bifidobacterium sp. SO4]MBT1170039.1 DEAD/DEAH box helicase [Bifidobacterium sp. SO4]
MGGGYGVFGHVSDDSDDLRDERSYSSGLQRRKGWRSADSDNDDLVDGIDDADGMGGYDDDAAASWGHRLRRQGSWRMGGHVVADADMDIEDPDAGNTDTSDADRDGVSDVTFGAGGSLTAADAVIPYRPYRQGKSVWFGDDEDAAVGKAGGGGTVSLGRSRGTQPVPLTELRRDVTTSVSNAVLDRARGIVRLADTMLIDPHYQADQRARYAELDAILRGTTSPGSRYRTNVQFDLDTGEVNGGSCTCPAYGRGYGMCKHMAALALAFCDEPQRFAGYKAGAVRPSRAVLSYMERMDQRDAQAKSRRRLAVMQRFGKDGGAPASGRFGRANGGRARSGANTDGYRFADTVAPGEVRLTPILRFIDGVWGVEFKIGAPANGSDYVLKSIPQFVAAIAAGTYESYGQKLAFTHTVDMFDDTSRPLLGFLKSALAIRQAAEQQDRYYGHIAIDRHMTLSKSEVAKLLDSRAGGSVKLVLDTWFAGQPATVPVEDGEPELAMRIMRRDFQVHGPDAGYLLSGMPPIETVVEGGTGAWLLLAPTGAVPGAVSAMMAGSQRISAAGCRFVRCPRRVLPLLGLLDELFAPDSPGQVIAGDDIALFARTLLPQLVGAGLLDAGELPRELVSLQPVDCEPEFYLDRDEHGVQCEVKARYGDAVVPLLPAGPVERNDSVGGMSGGSSGAGAGSADYGVGVVVGRDFDAEHLALDVVREFFTMPDTRMGVLSASLPSATATQTSGRRRGPAAGKRASASGSKASRSVGNAVRSVSGAAVINRDDTTQLVRLFDEGLTALHEVGKVFTTPAFDRLVAPAAPSVKVGLSIKGNLVEISPIADEVPPDEVGSLLASYRRRQQYHQLKDGTLVKLGGAKLDTLDRLARDLDLSEQDLNAGLIELPGSQAFLLDGELPDDGSDVVKDSSFTEYIDDLAIIDPQRYEVPDSLKHVLRPYQAEGFRWLNTLCDKGFGGILADEMGLGKSVQLIALLVSRYQQYRNDQPQTFDAASTDRIDGSGRSGNELATSGDSVRTMDAANQPDSSPSLIVCPASLVYNWAAEFAKFAPDLNAVVVAGSKAERRAAIARAFQSDGPTVLITSYDLLRRDVEDYTATEIAGGGASGSGTGAEPRRFMVMALDEAQYIKNHTTKIAKAVKSVAAEHRFALTGTPIENRLSELWSIFDFLMPGLLGSYKRFRERYELPIANGRAADQTPEEGRAAAQVNPEAARVAHKLQSLVGVFIKRRLKSQVLTDLPDKMETVLTVRLEGEQRKLYAAHEQRLRMQLEHSDQSDFNTSKIRILAELTRLRQICCDPRLLYADAKDQSAKLAAIAELVETCVNEGKKALIFSQFTSFLDLIAERFDAQGLRYYTITGSTPKKRRLELVDQFNADDTPAFLISLKAGNTGLNLTGASVVIHADPWWNAAAQDQATDRAHRIGQTENVNVYQVVAKDTIEERILELQHTKSELARQFTDASLAADDANELGVAGATGTASIATLTKDDLMGLLG